MAADAWAFPLDSRTNLHVGGPPALHATLLARRGPAARHVRLAASCEHDAACEPDAPEAVLPEVVLIDGAAGLDRLLEDCGEAAFDSVLLDAAALPHGEEPAAARGLAAALSADGVLTLLGAAEASAAWAAPLRHCGLRAIPGDGPHETAPECHDGLLQSARALRGGAAPAAPAVTRWRSGEPPLIDIAMTMLPPVGGVSDVRVTQPALALSGSAGVRTHLLLHNEAVPNVPGERKIFVYHRPRLAGPAGLAQLAWLIRDGWLVVCEFDDNPQHMSVLQAPDIYNFNGVHAVQTTTEALAEVMREYNPEVAVFPNAVPETPPPRNFRDDDALTLIYSGINREDEWPALLPALNHAAREAGSRLSLRIVGDYALFAALDTPHKQFVPVCDYPTYLSHVATADIAFMPLRDTAFNRCKSDLKFVECAAHRLVCVASETVYRLSIRDGETGLLFAGADDLQRHLLAILRDPPRARAIADAAQRYVREQRLLGGQVGPRIAWYRHLLANRARLHAALLARIPEFRVLRRD